MGPRAEGWNANACGKANLQVSCCHTELQVMMLPILLERLVKRLLLENHAWPEHHEKTQWMVRVERLVWIHGSHSSWRRQETWEGREVPEEDKKLERPATKIQQAVRKFWQKGNVSPQRAGWCRLSILQDQLSAPAVILKSIAGAKTGVVLIHPSDADPWVNGEQRFRTNHCVASFLDLRARAKIRQSVSR